MSEEYVDQITMLLSADWFTPHWETFGLVVDPSNREVVKLRARNEVNKTLGDCDIYWNVSFNSGRLNSSRQALAKIFAMCTRGGVFLNMIVGANDLEQRVGFEGDLTIICQLNGILINYSETGFNKNDLNPKIREVVGQLWSNEGIDYTDYDAISANSETDWDRKLRAMTPDLPTYLGDFLTVTVAARLRAFSFLEKLRGALSPADILVLERWYRAAAIELTGAQVSLSIN